MTLFINQPFISHSGKKLEFKIECDSLTDDDLDTLARQYASTIRNQIFGEIVGIPRGGLRFAHALRQHLITDGPITWRTNLIVDDVCTTGTSMNQFWEERYPNRFSGIQGVVIFARGPAQLG